MQAFWISMATGLAVTPSNWADSVVSWLLKDGVSFGINLVSAILVCSIGAWCCHLVRVLIFRFLGKIGMDSTTASHLGIIAHALLMIMVLITALGQLGVPTVLFAAVIGAVALAIGLSLRADLSNFASGFILAFSRPVRVGDYVAVGGAEGTIREIGTFSTALDTWDHKKIFVPNSAVTGGNIVNYSKNPKRLLAIPVAVSLQNDVSNVREAMISAVAMTQHCDWEPKVEAVVKELGERRMIMEVRAWCSAENYWDAYFSLNEILKIELEAAGVIPAIPDGRADC